MGTNVNEPSLKDLSHPSLNEQLKAYNTATFKLVKTGKVLEQKCLFAFVSEMPSLYSAYTFGVRV